MTRSLMSLGAVGAVALLLMTGCSAAPGEVEQAGVSTEPSRAAEPSTDPLAAEPTSEPTVDTSTPDGAFLDAIHRARAGAILSKQTQIPNATDDQLLAAGREACARVSAGETPETISLIEGETPDAAGYFTDSSAIIAAAVGSLCG